MKRMAGFVAREELAALPRRSDATELFVVIARAERPLFFGTLQARLLERGIRMSSARVRAALDELIRREMVTPSQRQYLTTVKWKAYLRRVWAD